MLSRRDYEKKLREEQEATAHVFQDFISTFQDSSGPPNKTFVKSGVLYPETGQPVSETCELYAPKPRIKAKDTIIKSAIECARILKNSKLEKSKKLPKPTSNLELLKEELKLRHFERDEKNKCKDEISMADNYLSEGDPNSTNLFVANLNPKITENDLMKLFGAYGPLASVKIMWPRGEERYRNTNCGFVAFMSRKDAERALNNLKHRDDMRVGWGKCVDIPTHPIYIPQSLLKLYLPPPFTGLPFNAQPLDTDYKSPANEMELQQLLKNSLVKVTLPLDKKVLMIVHRVIEFVIREGPLFEAYIMNKELDNPDYNFLFDNKNPVHIYYRWKLYSIQFGQGQKNWSNQPFRMFKGGSIWIPPVAPSYTDGMPDDLFNSDKKTEKCQLSSAQVSRLVYLIRNLTLSKISIAEAMVFCVGRPDAMNDIIQIIIDSLASTSSDPLKRVARIYLLSDVLYNCSTRKIKIQNMENVIPENLVIFFKNIKVLHDGFKCQYDKEAFKTRILKVLRSWDIWRLFPIALIRELESLILESEEHNEYDEGNSSNDEPLDGANIIKRSIKNKSSECQVPVDTNKKETTISGKLDGFVKSKWDTVDPSEVEAQAMSTMKLYELEKQRNKEARESKNTKKRNKKTSSNSNSGSATSKSKNRDATPTKVVSKWDSDEESKRITNRIDKDTKSKQMKRIDYLVKKYREDLETGFREIKRGYTIKQQVDKYRRRLVRDMEENCNFS